MAHIITVPGVTPAALPVSELLPWAALACLLFVLAVYFIGAEQGAVAVFKGTDVHEFTHDARHLLGFPCH